MIYNPSSSNVDIFWSGDGANSNEAQYKPPVTDWSYLRLYIEIDVQDDEIFVNEGDIIDLTGFIYYSGLWFYTIDSVTAVAIISDTLDNVLYENEVIVPPIIYSGTYDVNFGTWTVTGNRQNYIIVFVLDIPGHPYNNITALPFFVYPNPVNAFGWDSFQDSNYTNFPTFLVDGSPFINNGNWYPANASTGGWTVVDSTHSETDEYISTWVLEEFYFDNVRSQIRHMQGISNDNYHRDIDAEPQPQNELLYSPWYDVSGAETVTLEWDDDINGTDGDDNFPIHAFVDLFTDGGNSWLPVYHRTDSISGMEGTISGEESYLQYDVSESVSGADSVQIRFWWRNPNNDGSYATWVIDNVYLMNRTAVGTITDPMLLPKDFSLYQNYPNPFNPVTTIRYSLPDQVYVRLVVYDLLGREVAVLIDGVQPAGFHEIKWNTQNVASGVYFYQLSTTDTKNNPHLSSLKKMIVIK